MGSVWLAHNKVTERPFAIKLLHATIAKNPEMLARFIQESKVAKRPPNARPGPPRDVAK